MLITKKMLLALTLVAAIVGGGLGSLLTHSSSSAQTANDTTQPAQTATTASTAESQEAANAARFGTTAEQAAYREGFEQGYNSCATAANNLAPITSVATSRTARRYYNSSSSRRAYYDYNTQPRGRSFWQKHRDKLTMAIGTGAGAAIGGLVGGKKGAGIGALAGLGGSALYTYKLRRRTPRY